MNENTLKGFVDEMHKTGGIPLLIGAALGGTALGYGGKKLYDRYKAEKAKKEQLKMRQLHSNRLGQLASRMDPRLF